MSSVPAADTGAEGEDEGRSPIAAEVTSSEHVGEPADEADNEEDVAYDEEPDEAGHRADNNFAEAEAADEDVTVDAAAAADTVDSTVVHQNGSALRSDGSAADEWDLTPVLQEWKPAPLFKVKNIPTDNEVTEQTVRQVLENVDLAVKSVAFDSVKFLDKRVAYVRLQPPELTAASGTLSEAADKPEMDVSKIAISIVKQLKEADPPLQIGDDKLQFDTSHPQVQLFIGNITEEWSTDASLRTKMEEYGPVERCLVMRSYKGQNKGYAFVEYSVPNGALKCKEGMDKIEAEMRPDFRRKEGLTIQANGRWQQIKLLRAEWAHPRTVAGLYSRVLYITNLTPGLSDTAGLKQLFEKFGPVSECHLPRNKQTGNSKGFAFVEFRQSIFADAAYRAVDETDQEFMGSKLVVSFANPAKHYDTHAIRPQTNFTPSISNPATSKLAGQASAGTAGHMLAQRAALLAGKPGLGGRINPSQAFAAGNAAQLALPGMGFNSEDMAARMQQQTLAMQQQMQLQYQRHMQMTMQQQLRAQQALMQAQLRAAQAQVQQYQEQALQYKTQANQAQLEAQQEAEARKRLEAEARAVAQARMTPTPASNYGASGSEGGYGLSPAAFAAYGHAGYPGAMGVSGQDMYGANAMYSQGFASASQAWPSGASVGQANTNTSDGAGGFASGAGGQQAGYSMPQDSFGQASSYPQQPGFGAFSPHQAAMANPQAAYNMGYGAQTAGNSPYGTAFPQGAAAFTPQSSTGLQSGQKRDSAYDQAGVYGGYGSYGTAGTQAGQDYKRQRY